MKHGLNINGMNVANPMQTGLMQEFTGPITNAMVPNLL